ncbi:MAG: sensor histidine kinase, partial [Chthoniobacteraceae bacterium]
TYSIVLDPHHDPLQIARQCHRRSLRMGMLADVALCLYRSAQEALRNVCKHAHAKAATVTLTRDLQGIVMRIEDDGVGVSVDNGSARPGLGLISLRERAHLLRGSFSVTPGTAGGTCLEVGIPGD